LYFRITFQRKSHILKIALTGPESSGKTYLANYISEKYAYFLIDEYSRTYLEQLAVPYRLDDVIHMAQEQHERILSAPHSNLVVDTESIVSKIWLEEKYGKSLDWIEDQIANEQFDIYLLCAPDIPWEYDPLRENPHDRDRLFEIFKRVLEDKKLTYQIISGSENQRQMLVDVLLSH
jgi:nicotinamide riboside kinase